MEPRIFNHPRPRKSLLPPLARKRKREPASKIEEIAFDFDARADYLTGFHKRKVQRATRAKAEAEKKAKEEKLVLRKQLREERKQELEEHVEAVNALLSGVEGDSAEGKEEEEAWDGIEDEGQVVGPVDHEEEYIDEDRYTTVTVEAVDVSKEGLIRVGDEDSTDETAEADTKFVEKEASKKKVWPKKERKKKFRYESKAERKFTRTKQKAGNKARADARRGND